MNDVINARCHCGSAQFSYDVSKAGFELPLKSAICHCGDCRHSTGSLFSTFAVIPAERPDFSKLVEYQSSRNLSRYFCGTCGATIGNIEPTEWELAPGLFDNVSGRLLNRVQMFVSSSSDAGASAWLPSELYGRPLKRCSRGRDSAEVSDKELAAMVSSTGVSESEKLHGKCHCGAVQFYITRPAVDAPDTKHIGRKYKAAPCPCYSCRATSGEEFMAWVYVAPSNIYSPDGTPYDIDNPSLTHYSSSKDVDRTFCRTCGAKVFYRSFHDASQGLWDIAVGLFDAKGARLEDWLDWDPAELAFLDEATDAELGEAIKNGVAARYREIAD